MKQVAVVILNYNGADTLRRFLPSVTKYSPDSEVYVADNGSSDNSCNVVRDEFPTVHLIELDKNYGFAEGYNRALAQIKEEYVVLLNSDVEVTPDWIAPMADILNTNPDVAACQPKILSYNNRHLFEYAGAAGGYIDKWGYTYCRGRIFGTVEEDNGQYDDVADVFWATGAALMIRNDEYKHNGGLDSRFFAHMEEVDLCWRLRSRGKRLVCVPESRVFHVGGATLSKDNPRKTYFNFRNNLLMIYKNMPNDRLTAVMLFRKFFDNIAAIKFLFTSNVNAFKAVRKARRDFRDMKEEFAAARSENMRRATGEKLPEMFSKSILAQYYIKFHHKYSSLR